MEQSQGCGFHSLSQARDQAQDPIFCPVSGLQFSPWSYAITDKCTSTEHEIKDVWVNYNPISLEN